MTTYPLSEAATVHVGDADAGDLRGHGTLEECVALIEGLSPDDRGLARVNMDNFDLEYGAGEISELIDFLRQEKPGLSDRDIAAPPKYRPMTGGRINLFSRHDHGRRPMPMLSR